MKREIAAGSLVALSTIALAGCFGSDESPAPATTVTEAAPPATTQAPAPATTEAAPPATTQAAATSFTAPSGATELQSAQRDGAQYNRYSITGTAPSAVTSDYQSQMESAGFKVTSSGGGGGGWGKWGGASAGVEGNNGSEWVSVQAGGESGSTTYFEVCVGPSSSSVDDCEDVSDDSDSKQS
jgi:hypothetical protein